MTFAGQPDSLPVVDARGYLDLDVALLEHAVCAVAFLARLLDELPGAVARRACPGAHELPEDAARDLTHAAVAATGRAGADLRLRLGAVSSAALARNRDAEWHVALGSRRHVGMQLAGEAPERALDLVGVRRSRHAKKLVVVAFSRRHR